MKITTLHTLDTEYSADSIEWCPHPDFTAYFVCGTYQLEGDTSESKSPPCRRKGRIYLFNYDKATNVLRELFRIETAAILDMKWLLNDSLDHPTLAAANALGQIEVFTLEADELVLKSSFDLNLEDHNLLALSLDWSVRTQQLVASDSKGDVHILNYTAERLEKEQTWSSHNFEAWICAFDKWNSNVVYTGGDDTFLNVFDIRSTEKPMLKNKSHIAGVTCLLSHPQKENILLTGSYDERLRVFDTRSMKSPTSELNLNGGIWRLKSDPIDLDYVLCACMYHNFSVVQLGGVGGLELRGELNAHESICYGADWSADVCKQSGREQELYMATCSFYDHKLCISSVSEF